MVADVSLPYHSVGMFVRVVGLLIVTSVLMWSVVAAVVRDLQCYVLVAREDPGTTAESARP